MPPGKQTTSSLQSIYILRTSRALPCWFLQMIAIPGPSNPFLFHLMLERRVLPLTDHTASTAEQRECRVCPFNRVQREHITSPGIPSALSTPHLGGGFRELNVQPHLGTGMSNLPLHTRGAEEAESGQGPGCCWRSPPETGAISWPHPCPSDVVRRNDWTLQKRKTAKRLCMKRDERVSPSTISEGSGSTYLAVHGSSPTSPMRPLPQLGPS